VSKERDRCRLLLEVNNAVVSNLHLSELLKTISTRLGEVIEHDSAFIALCGPEDTEMEIQALDLGRLENVKFREGLKIPVAGTPEERAMKSRRPVLLRSSNDLLSFSSPWMPYAVERGIQSSVSLPLIAHDRVLGALGVVSLRPATFTEEDTTLLEQCSTQIAIAVENALHFENARRAEREVRKQRDRSQLLLELNNALVSHLDLHELVKTISVSLQQVLQHDFVGLALYEAESGKVVARARDSSADAIVPFDPEGTTSGLAYRAGRSVYLPRPDRTAFPSEVTAEFFDKGMKTFFSVPVTVRDQKLGVLTLASIREDALTEDDKELVEQITKQVALAAANALIVSDWKR
jgi:formate hydrogenlyase transcriptional activator